MVGAPCCGGGGRVTAGGCGCNGWMWDWMMGCCWGMVIGWPEIGLGGGSECEGGGTGC